MAVHTKNTKTLEYDYTMNRCIYKIDRKPVNSRNRPILCEVCNGYNTECRWYESKRHFQEWINKRSLNENN